MTDTTSILLDMYFKLQDDIHEYFGYTEDWKVIPLNDSREYYWNLDEEKGVVQFSETEDCLKDETCDEYYENTIYTQRFLTKYVYRTDNFTMICVDTNTDGNKFLQIFDNDKDLSDVVTTHETMQEFITKGIEEQNK